MIISVMVEGELRRRKIHDDTCLETWVKQLGVQCLLDEQGIETPQYTDLNETTVYQRGPARQLNGAPTTYTVTLRPWVGYAEMDPLQVVVSSVEELLEKARNFVNCTSAIRLYHYKLGEDGIPLDISHRKQVNSVFDLSMAAKDSGGVVWVYEYKGSSPQSSPQRRKPCSPFVVPSLAGAAFGELPEIYEDCALREVKKFAEAGFSDKHIQFILAIPGSGKSRTVAEAAQQMGIQVCRVKFLEARYLDIIKEKITELTTANEGERRTATYDKWKMELSSVIRKILMVEIEQQINDLEGSKMIFLHVDEIQTMMGSEEVSRDDWSDKQDPCNMMMPSLCSTLVALMEERPNFRCILTGTNFFARLILNPGSEMKPDYVGLDGTFPVRWVMQQLVEKYFNIPMELSEPMRNHIAFLSWNRRAIQHFMFQLKSFLDGKKEGDTLAREDLQSVRNRAFNAWKEPIARALGAGRVAVTMVMSSIIFPEAYDGKKDGDTLVFREKKLPKEVKQFCLAGGLNMSVSVGYITIRIPGGCVWGYLCEATSGVLLANSLNEIEAFTTVAKSVETERGHLFERIVAAELSMLSNGDSTLYSQFQRLWKGDGMLIPDPLVFGQPFEYKSVISPDQWKDHQVYCVAELAKDNGKRKVDVGFPMLLSINGKNKPVKFVCELKKGYTTSELWTHCCTFFEEMKGQVKEDGAVIACFMASDPFLDTKPRKSPKKKQKKASGGNNKRKDSIGAKESRKKALEFVESSPYFIIFDNVKENSMFPLRALLKGEAIDHGFQAIGDVVEGRYLGSQP